MNSFPITRTRNTIITQPSFFNRPQFFFKRNSLIISDGTLFKHTLLFLFRLKRYSRDLYLNRFVVVPVFFNIDLRPARHSITVSLLCILSHGLFYRVFERSHFTGIDLKLNLFAAARNLHQNSFERTASYLENYISQQNVKTSLTLRHYINIEYKCCSV